MSKRVGSRHPARTIVGYCWPWSLRPGEAVDFMVSTNSSAADYRADLVRIICAENLSNPDLFKELELHAPFTGSYTALRQETHIGSYVEIAPRPALDNLGSFTVQVMVMPTLLPAGVRQRTGGFSRFAEMPVLQDQHLVSRWDNRRRRGWALVIDASGCAAFISGDGASVHRTTLSKPLIQDQWFLVMVAYDAVSRTVSICARAVSQFVKQNVGWPEAHIRARHGTDLPIVHEGVLRFAACTDGPGNGQRLKPGSCFSGRLDRVRLSAGALTGEQAFRLADEKIPDSLSAPLIGFWDFAQGIDSTEVHDLSPNQLHGVAVNMPMRAVAGVAWDGSVIDWRQRPEHYSAIHFHDDDLYDAEWKSDFSYTVPEDLPSGIYAARLRQGAAEDYIPFFVAPPRGTARASVALLIPTMTYLAYTNIEDFTTQMKRRKRIHDVNGAVCVVEEDRASGILQDAAHADFLAANLRTLGKGAYAQHTDGTGFEVASPRHPNMTIKPKGIQWTLVADSLTVDWLEHKGVRYDIITDELLHTEGVDLLSRYKAVITGNHPEYYSRAMLNSLEQYKELGGRLMYLGANGFYVVTSLHDQWPGAIEVRKNFIYSGHSKPYEMFHACDGVHGGTWEDNGRAPQLLVGISTNMDTGFAFEGSAPYRRLPDSYNSRAHFIFAGVNSEIFGDYGVLGGGAAGQELDCVSAELGTPPHALHLARADQFPSHVSMFEEQYALNAPMPFGDMVYFETANGGAVFSVGSMSWVGSLSHNNYDNDVSRITENVLRHFLDETPLNCADRSVGDAESMSSAEAAER